MLSRILVPVRGDGMAETVVGHAAALAERHKAHIVVAHCRAQADAFMPYSVPLPAFARETILSQAKELADQQEAEVRDQLHAIAARLGLVETDAPAPGTTSVAMIEEFGSMEDIIKHHGRLADLIVVAKPDRDRNLGTNALKSGLFRTGRPVLMCPPDRDVAAGLGRHLAVAWNGSLEASRAVASTLDLAKTAETVTILCGGRGEPHGATAEDLVSYYALRGIAATSHRFDTRNPGAGLLSKTVEVGADLLIMGAYGHNHERETILGGNTQAVVDKAEIPVILVH
jgi:nucleotide-binding universal stress UspA family protein